MRTMVDLGRGEGGRLHIIDTPTSVDCGREVRLRRSLRTLVECMVPSCCAFPATSDDSLSTADSDGGGGATVTFTFFGHRKGRVSFCIQEDTKAAPLLLLEFAVPTSFLAREMQHGLLRIALESRRRGCSLYDAGVWCIYCNGRKVGYAANRRLTPADAAVLKLMQSVSVGAGVLPAAEEDDGDLLYLRASFDRVVGSADSESFHMRNPAGSSGQELSVFLLRS